MPTEQRKLAFNKVAFLAFRDYLKRQILSLEIQNQNMLFEMVSNSWYVAYALTQLPFEDKERAFNFDQISFLNIDLPKDDVGWHAFIVDIIEDYLALYNMDCHLGGLDYVQREEIKGETYFTFPAEPYGLKQLSLFGEQRYVVGKGDDIIADFIFNSTSETLTTSDFEEKTLKADIYRLVKVGELHASEVDENRIQHSTFVSNVELDKQEGEA